jgi:hypothetical protein
MYGRETSVGYQNVIFTGSFKPAALSSAFDFAGLYGYCLTVFE